jgi:hypothetical protein
MMATVRRVCRNVKRWRNAAMVLRWTAAAMMEAGKGFRRLNAYKNARSQAARNPSPSSNKLKTMLMPIASSAATLPSPTNLGHPFAASRQSLCLNGGKLDHLFPLFGLFRNEARKFGGSRYQWRAALISLLSLSITALGVSRGAPTPDHPLASYPGTNSPTVGTSGEHLLAHCGGYRQGPKFAGSNVLD